MMISIHHHATDLSDIFLDWCVITTHPKFHMTAIYRCATRAQDASGCKSRPGNYRFIPVATQTVGWRDPPAEALGTDVSL